MIIKNILIKDSFHWLKVVAEKINGSLCMYFIYQHKAVKKKYIIFNFYGPFVQLFFASDSFNTLCMQFHRHSHNGNLQVYFLYPFCWLIYFVAHVIGINSLNIYLPWKFTDFIATEYIINLFLLKAT